MTSRLTKALPVAVLAIALATTAVGNAPAGADMAGSDAPTVAPAAGSGAHQQPTDSGAYVTFKPGPGRFPLVARHHAAPLVVSSDDYPGVTRVVDDLSADIRSVTGVRPTVAVDKVPAQREVVIIGTLGHSPIVDKLVSTGKVDVTGVAGKWETSLQQVVQRPMPGVDRALVIAGSDQRGTIYGAYDVSRGIGVSPWSYWDDVKPAHRDDLYVLPGRHSQGTPAVKYRGFFINDENPSLGRWAPRTFGPGAAPGYPNGFNKAFYSQVFETMLRLKANYLWPAVWGRAFAEDDPQNHATAKRYGVVMGTSHEAPMMRGIEEWNRHAVAAVRDADGNITKEGHDPYGGTGEWSFRRNADAVKAYWRDGLERMKAEGFEGVVTLGMRGNGDVSLPDGDGIELMQQIISAQRSMIADVFGSADAVPQVWSLYKEVQRYWDKGLRVPDDVIVNFTDDNWGNIRKLADRSSTPRAGGYGLYYHFDYVGGGRNYKWVDTNSLTNIWDQLHQTASYGKQNLWVTNVGDLKGNEMPTQFFLDYAWNPDRWPVEKLGEWEEQYVAENFGDKRAREIADVLHDYAHLQTIRKPELLNRKISVDPTKDIRTDSSAVVYDDTATPFSLSDYREIERVSADWARVANEAERIGRSLPASAKDAYYGLVLYQVKATANLYALRKAEFTNILYASQGRAATNDLADLAEARFADDQAMSDYYNNTLAGGKWKDFQTQPHIGYGDVARYGPNAPWQQPELDNEALPDEIFPAMQRIETPAGAEMGVAIDGSDKWWPNESSPAVLPTFSPYQSQPTQYVEVFNRGSAPFHYAITSGVPWLKVTDRQGSVDKQVRSSLTVDWGRAPKGVTTVPLTVTGTGGRTVTVQAVVDNTRHAGKVTGFVEANGYVSMEADHFTKAVSGNGVRWQRLPDIGRTGSGMEPFPVTASAQTPGPGSPRLDYRINVAKAGPVDVWAFLSPRNDVLTTSGLRYAVSVDGGTPQVVDVTAATGANHTSMNRQWERNTSDNVNRTKTTHVIDKAGAHTVTFWAVDPTVVLQKLVVDTGGLEPSYLGPPESRRFPIKH